VFDSNERFYLLLIPPKRPPPFIRANLEALLEMLAEADRTLEADFFVIGEYSIY